jgi:heme-degrading monooxygenase HmoA
MTISPEPPRAPLSPPYYAVIFTSHRATAPAETHMSAPSIRAMADQDYQNMSDLMLALAQQQDGFLGLHSLRDPITHFGITISYWRDTAAIAAWREQADHRIAQAKGRSHYYRDFSVQISRVERSYSFTAPDTAF